MVVVVKNYANRSNKAFLQKINFSKLLFFKSFLLNWEIFVLILQYSCVFGYTHFTRTRKIDLRLSFLIFQRQTSLKMLLFSFIYFLLFVCLFDLFWVFLSFLKSAWFASLGIYAISQVIFNIMHLVFLTGRYIVPYAHRFSESCNFCDVGEKKP